MTRAPEVFKQVADIVETDLTERFADEVVFGPIVVAPATNGYGDDYLRIIVVVRDGEILDPNQLNLAGVSIRNKLCAMDVLEFPNLRFVDKSDWLDPELYDGGKRGVYLEGY